MSSANPISDSRPPAASGSFLSTWVSAVRPRTLIVSVVPVAVGTALAHAHQTARGGVAIAALAGALLIQVGTNLFNDYYDFKKGADTASRLGPVRVTQSGLIAPESVLKAGAICFAAATVVGSYLAVVGGWPIVLVGLLSLGAGYAYTGGPFPLGYHGLGDVFVFVFFGVLAVAGTYYVQALALNPVVWWAAIPVGAIATAVLVVNNLRDLATDKKAGKRTLAVRLGARATQIEYCALLGLAALVPGLLWAAGWARPWLLISYAALPLAIRPLRRVLSVPAVSTGEKGRGETLNAALSETARLHLVFGTLFALGLTFSIGGNR